VGGFDDDLFLFAEDTDLCLRMAKHGWSVFYLGNARAVHYLGGSMRQLGVRSIIEHHRSLYRFFMKHAGPGLPLRLVLQSGLAVRLCWVMALYPLTGGGNRCTG
jgi:GT2 family glycosyltransferase